MEHSKLAEARILVWDIDGVLIYVRDSYRKAIIDTVQYYFTELAGLSLKRPLLSVSDTQHFKVVKGFNDDWKLTYACVLSILCDLVGRVPEVEKLSTVTPLTTEKKLYALKMLGEELGRIDLEGFVPGISAVTERIGGEGHDLESTENALVSIHGERVVSIAKSYWYRDIIKTIFQEMYLGAELYSKKYGVDPVYVECPGLISTEKGIISVENLARLAMFYYMGVASGRERFEIEYSLKSHGFDRFMPPDLVVSSEDVSMGKPDPESLLLCSKRIIGKYGLEDDAGCVYVGDSVDDVRAAKKAGFYSVGCLSASSDPGEKERLRREFENLGCDLILDDANELAGKLRF